MEASTCIFQFPRKTHKQKPSQGTSYLVNDQVRGPFPTLWMTRSQKLKWSQITLNVKSPDEYCEKKPECHLPSSSWGDQHPGRGINDTLSVKNPQSAPQDSTVSVILRHDLQTDSKLKMRKYGANMVLQERIDLIQIIAWVGSNILNIKSNHLKILLLGKRKLPNLMMLV